MNIPFVGREKEIKLLSEAMGEVRSGRGRAFFITGPVGIGKTRLLREFSQHAEKNGFVVLFCRAIDEKAVPYLPVKDALDEYMSKHREEQPLPIGLIGALSSTQEVEFAQTNVLAREKTRLLERYLGLFEKLSSSAPVLLAIDDLHWADSGTLSLFHYITRNVSELRMLVLGAYTDEYFRGGRNTFVDTVQHINIERKCPAITLHPFTVDDVSVVLGSILGTWKVPEDFVYAVHRRTGGNPLFVEEVGRSIVEQGLFDINERKLKVNFSQIQLPDSVKTMISQRIANLDENTTKVLRACAVLGREFEYEVLKNTLEMDDETLLEVIDNLITTGYIDQGEGVEETYRFVHNPMWEVVYTSISAPRRRMLHKKAGEELEKAHGKERKYWSEIGRHYFLGGELNKGATYKILAAEDALTNYAIEECVDACEEVIKVLPNISDNDFKQDCTIKTYTLLGDARYIVCEYDEAITAYESALKVATDRNTRINLMIKLSYPHLGKGNLDKCLAILEGAFGMLAENDHAGRAEILKNIGWAYEKKGEFLKAVECYKKSLLMSEKAGEEITIGEVYHRLGTGLWYLGELKDALRFLERGLEIRKKHNLKKGIAGSYNNIAIVLKDMGDILKAMEYYEYAKKIYEEIGDISGVATVYHNLAIIYSLLGEDAKAIEFDKKDLEISRRIGDAPSQALAAYALGECYQDMKDYATAMNYYNEAIQASERYDDKRMLGWSFAALARLHAENGKFDEAEKYLDMAMKYAEATGNKELLGVAYTSRGDVLLYEKKFEASEREYQKAIEIYREVGQVESIQSTNYALAKLYIAWEKYELARRLLFEARDFYIKINGKGMIKKIDEELKRIEENEKI